LEVETASASSDTLIAAVVTPTVSPLPPDVKLAELKTATPGFERERDADVAPPSSV
jgi:hypothetical protein